LPEGDRLPRLDLLVVDEEHRFGVAHKERLKQIKKTVDVVTLTATPIPRTLQLAFAGLRDLSVIDTPPADRLAIRTQVCDFSDALIREAILRELRRGGQVFFVHNRVQTISSFAAWRADGAEARLVVATARCRSASSSSACCVSCTARPTCCCAPRSSRAASTTRARTRS
jgi:transcription-repair coupling factor (superfamily II helicase)